MPLRTVSGKGNTMSYPYIDDDRDDTYDPEFRQDTDYCEPHGTYIGPPGGADIMCMDCELGISADEAREIWTERKTRKVRGVGNACHKAIGLLLSSGIGGIKVADYVQDTNYTGNPRSRYGRH